MRRCEVSVLVVVALLVGVSLCHEEHDIKNQIRSQPDIPFRITRVTKQEGADSVNLRIEYQATNKPVVLQRESYDGPPTVLEEQGMGLLELDVPKRRAPDPEDARYGARDVSLHFVESGLFHSATFRLYGTPDVMEVPSIELTVPQGHDLRYAPGSQLNLSFTWTVGGDRAAIEREYVYYTITAKSDTEENVINRFISAEIGELGQSIWVGAESLDGQKGQWRGSGQILSTRAYPEGVLDVFPTLTFECAVNCLLVEFAPNYRVRFYRNDHAGPYPPNFIGFLRDDHEISSTVTYCEIGHGVQDGNVTCMVHCGVIGALTTQTRISKVLPSGDVLEMENDVTLSNGDQSNAALVVHNVRYADRDVYRCTGTSDVSRITKDIHVVPVRRPNIDRSASSLVKHDNGTVTGVCVARGVPAPNVSFTNTDGSPFNRLSPNPYDVSVTQTDQWTTRAELIITDTDVARRVYSLQCFANNMAGLSEKHRYRFADDYYMSTYDW